MLRLKQNKIYKTPTLNYQASGVRQQDQVPFKVEKLDLANCPSCFLRCTMALEDHAALNAANEARRSASKDGKFEARSTVHGCYAFDQNCYGNAAGLGCWACQDKVRRGVQPRATSTPGACAFACEICASDCQATFQEIKH